jgi:4-hydroxy-tetrahydrodipicolinate synthase
MNRRAFSTQIGLALSGAFASARTSSAGTSRTEKKQWAHEHLKGMENVVMPSFSPDFKDLDEEGIRHDVRQSIKHGFCSSTVSAIGANAAQRTRLMEIVRDESGNRILSSVIVGGSAESAIPALAEAEKLGFTHAMVTFPSNLHPQSEDEIYTHFRKVVDSTSLAILLYGSDVPALRRFHPSGIPVGVFDRLADVPNVVGMKLTQPMSAATAYELCDRLSSRLILGPVNLDLVPVLGKNYPNVQWSGEWIVEAVQSPENPYAVEFMDLVGRRRMNEAMKVYWRMQPLVEAIYDLQAPLLLHGSHPWAHMKYFQWSTGGNGGLLPLKPSQYLPVLDSTGRALIRNNYLKAGIALANRLEEEFMVGRTNYARGIRAASLASTPVYA